MPYILTDIEGTTTSISFVHDVLFPYFIEHFPAFVRNHGDDSVLKENVRAVQATVLEEEGSSISDEEAHAVLIRWAKADRKHTALKALQGWVWRAAYLSGEVRSHVYSDVPPALKRWQEKGFVMGVYSSGSIEAQQLLFGHTIYGDLTPYFSHYFDTRVGAKREVESYQNIAEALFRRPSDILFLSDVEAELDAAQQAGFHTLQLVRLGTVPGFRHSIATDFQEVGHQMIPLFS